MIVRFLFRTGALATASASAFMAAAAQAQTPDAPAAQTIMAPQPTLAEEIVHIRDMMAIQSMRLEEAAETIRKVSGIADQQSERIRVLEAQLGETRAAAGAAPGGANNGAYVVQAGETLYRIARKTGVSIDTLIRENRIGSPSRLRVGQVLVIPGADGAPTTVMATQPPAPTPVAETVTSPAAPAPAASTASVAAASAPSEVGQRPAENLNEPYLALASDVGGILTPEGTLYFEPELDYSQSSENRFFFSGTEIIDAILIGVIEATDTDRLALVARAGLRYGVTDRLEVDAKIPLVYRDDRVSGVALDESTEFVRNLSGAGLGDIELGVHYQLTNGVNFPYSIANLRVKAPTGKGPFEVDRAPSGVELDSATGSGFWTAEPSVTFIIPTDPAVIYANVGYQINFAMSPVEQVGASIIRTYDPADAIRASVGVGLAVNERLSLNFGYDLSQYFTTSLGIETIDTQNGATILTDARQPRVSVGSFGIGGSYFVNDKIRLTLNSAFGATDEAPDMRLLLRAQIKLAD